MNSTESSEGDKMRTCCRQLIGELRLVTSPFVRLIATEYYDGPVDGLVQCESCGLIYEFHKLDWDNGQDLRVFSLAPTRVALDAFDALFTRADSATVLLTADRVEGADIGVRRAIEAAGVVEFVVASRDLLKRIEVWRPAGVPQGIDWFEELGLSRAAED